MACHGLQVASDLRATPWWFCRTKPGNLASFRWGRFSLAPPCSFWNLSSDDESQRSISCQFTSQHERAVSAPRWTSDECSDVYIQLGRMFAESTSNTTTKGIEACWADPLVGWTNFCTHRNINLCACAFSSNDQRTQAESKGASDDGSIALAHDVPNGVFTCGEFRRVQVCDESYITLISFAWPFF